MSEQHTPGRCMRLPVAAYIQDRHDVGCATLDLWPGACDCGAEDRRVPLVEKRAAEAIIANLTAQIGKLRKSRALIAKVEGGGV